MRLEVLQRNEFVLTPPGPSVDCLVNVPWPPVSLHFSIHKIFEEANTTGETATDSRTSSLLMKESSELNLKIM